jgi:hypothetical protein
MELKNLKQIGFFLLAGALFFWAPLSVQAGGTTGGLLAQVLSDLSIIQEQQLNFGSFAVSPSTSGTVTVNTSGTTVTGGVQKITAGNQGQFKFSGAPNGFFVFFSSSPVFNVSNGSATMQVQVLNPVAFGQLNGAGNYTYKVDGKINVNAGQAAGTYVGTYPVTVSYF